MDIGVGLPSHLPGVDGKTVMEWARRAETLGFSSLAVIDRIVYDNYEPLITLAGAAAVTERIRLMTAILIGPYRTNTSLLAKQVATVDALSGGRFVLGIAIGNREDDYITSGASFDHRGRRLEEQIAEMRRIWSGESRGTAGAIGPRPKRGGGPEIILGGHSDAAIKRASRIADGWIMGGRATPEGFAQFAEKVKGAWSARGRKDKPRMIALNYFGLGADALPDSKKAVRDYYSFAGPYADQVAGGVLGSDGEIKDRISGLDRAGCDEVLFFPGVSNIDQLDKLAAVAGL